MLTASAQRISPSALVLPIILLLGGFAIAAASSMAAEGLLIYWITLAGLAGFFMYAALGDPLIAVFVWFITLITMHEELWRQEVPGFFALTVPRIGIVLVVALFLAMVALGRIRLRSAWPLSGAIITLLAYFLLSAAATGFETRSIVTVHYRLIGGYVFPFAVFAVVLHSFHREVDFKRLTIFFAGIALYLTYTGWCEQFKLYGLVWPAFIGDPQVGIHWGRVRGPFVLAPAMGFALTFCFYNNLVLARNSFALKLPLYILNALMLPAIFWTKTRSVWLSFVVCALIWSLYARRRVSRVVIVSLLLAASLMVAVINMENFLGEDRSKGGLTDTSPIVLRIGLAELTWDIVKKNPLFGVGFGHFRDAAPNYSRNPSSPFYAFGSNAMEHNNLLSIAAETGIVGLALYFLVIILIIRSSVSLYRKLSPSGMGIISRDLLVLYWILMAAYFIDGTFRETSDNPFANSLFFGLSAVPVALDILLRPSLLHARRGFPAFGGPVSPPPREAGANRAKAKFSPARKRPSAEGAGG